MSDMLDDAKTFLWIAVIGGGAYAVYKIGNKFGWWDEATPPGSMNTDPKNNPTAYDSIYSNASMQTQLKTGDGSVNIPRAGSSVAGDSIVNLRWQNPDGSISTYHVDLYDLTDPQKRALESGRWKIENDTLKFTLLDPTSIGGQIMNAAEHPIQTIKKFINDVSMPTQLTGTTALISSSGTNYGYVASANLGKVTITDDGYSTYIRSEGGNLAPVGQYNGPSSPITNYSAPAGSGPGVYAEPSLHRK